MQQRPPTAASAGCPLRYSPPPSCWKISSWSTVHSYRRYRYLLFPCFCLYMLCSAKHRLQSVKVS